MSRRVQRVRSLVRGTRYRDGDRVKVITRAIDLRKKFTTWCEGYRWQLCPPPARSDMARPALGRVSQTCPHRHPQWGWQFTRRGQLPMQFWQFTWSSQEGNFDPSSSGALKMCLPFLRSLASEFVSIDCDYLVWNQAQLVKLSIGKSRSISISYCHLFLIRNIIFVLIKIKKSLLYKKLSH